MSVKKSRKEKLTAQRRGQILKAATDVFSRKGYAAATIPEIAKLAGVATGTIYLYFPNKRELFIAAVKDIIITTPLLNLIGKIPTGDFADVFKQILVDRFELIKNETVSLMPALIGEVLRDSELKGLWLKEFLHPFFARMETVYRMMSVSGKARRFEPAVIVRAIGGMIFGFLMLKIVEGESNPLDKMPPEKVAEDIVEFVLHGVLSDAEKKKPGKDGTL